MSAKKILGVVITVECYACNGTTWVPDQPARSRGNVGATKPCYKCGNRGTVDHRVSLADFRAAIEALETKGTL